MPDLPARWRAQWVSPTENTGPDDGERVHQADRPGYLIERDITLATAPEHAVWHLSALGLYEAFINGQRVGDVELAPGASNYDATVYAQTHDVTSLLRTGANTLAILLSDGWFRGRAGSERQRDSWGTTTAALAQLDLALPDGSTQVVGTDGAWTSRVSQVVRADLMDGQTTDFSRAPSARKPVRVAMVDPPAPTRSPAPPVRRVAELSPVSLRELLPGVSIVDFGQNIAGWVRLEDVGPPGAHTTIEFGEHLEPAGDLDTSHLDVHSPGGDHVPFRQVDDVIAGTGAEVFEPRHTIHGFRYARVTHLGRDLAAAALTAVVVHSDLTPAGTFACSDDRVNRLYDAVRWSWRGNSVDLPTDCPTRERQGWTGDFQVFASTAALMYDIGGFARKWLRAVRDDQYDNGCLPMFSPDTLRMKHSDSPARVGGGSAGWGDAAVAVPWDLYEHEGDPAVLEEAWQSAHSWVTYALGCARTFRHPSRVERNETPLPHEQYVWDGPFHFGEWCEPRDLDPPNDPAAAFARLTASDQGEVGTAYLYRSVDQLARIAEILGKFTDAARLRETAGLVRDAWRTEFLRPDGCTAMDSQAAYVRAIAFGLMPPELLESAMSRLVELIHARDDHLGTGFLSTGMLLPVLADGGHAGLAYRLLTRTGVPSWLEMLERGATTIWENWGNVDEEGNARPGSLNHYSKGAFARFLHTHVAGLRQAPGSVGWTSVVVAPVLGGGLTWAATELVTAPGIFRVRWDRAGNDITLQVTVPPEVQAIAALPGLPSKALPPGQTTTISARVPAAQTETRTYR